MKILKLTYFALIAFLLASCDTGYSGDIDPNKEIFNYEYPLQKGNTWTYLVTEKMCNFSNPSALADLGADTVLYYQVKQICKNDTAWFSDAGRILHKLDSYQSNKANNQAFIDTTVCPAKTSYYMDNISGFYLEYGRWDSITVNNSGNTGTVISTISYATPFKILKYDTYQGDQWQQTIFMSEINCKISGFMDLNSERVCLINKTELIPESPATPSPADTAFHAEYYSRRGLVKAVSTNFKKNMTTTNGNYTTYDLIITKELIRTNAK